MFDVSPSANAAPYVKLPIPQCSIAPYPRQMVAHARARPASPTICLFLIGIVLATTCGGAVAAPRARLVHCGNATCLRISGHRSHDAVEVRIAEQALEVKGDRDWRATVPLAVARDWTGADRGTLAVTLSDPQTGQQRTEQVILPPGALGRRIELASLIVAAH